MGLGHEIGSAGAGPSQPRPASSAEAIPSSAFPDQEHPALIVREPVETDAPSIGTVHVRAWQKAYRGGLMPDEYLDGLFGDERAQMWAEGLRRPPRTTFARFVAEDDGGSVVGFVTVGPADGELNSSEGELYALNVDPDAWGRGFGQALLLAATDALSEAGFREALLWVHPGNERARAFYERFGWGSDGGQRQEEVLGVLVPEVRYRRPLGN